MHSPRLLPLFGSLLAVAAVAVAQEDPAPAAPVVVDKTGTYCTVHCHGGDEAMAEQALQVVDRVWPLVAEVFGDADAHPEHPLDVHLYRTVAGYEAAEHELTQGKFRRNQAMCHWESRSAHVALQPPCTDETLRAIGLPVLTLRMLAWETAHAARFTLCANFRSHPEWFGDGLAACVAEAVLAAASVTTVDDDPQRSTHALRVRRLLAQKQLPPVRSILGDAVEDLELADRYAVRAEFLRMWFAEPRRPRLRAVAAAVRATDAGEGYAAKVLAAATKAAGGGADRAFRSWLEALTPKWDEVFRSLGAQGNEWRQVAFPDYNAVAWNMVPVKGRRLSVAGQLRILPGGRRQLNFLFGRTDDGSFGSIAFVADQGFTVFHFDAARKDWQRLADGNAPGLRCGVSTAFAIDVDGRKLHLVIDTQSWDVELPAPLPAQVTWGLGAQAGPDGGDTGSAGIWSGLTVAASATRGK